METEEYAVAQEIDHDPSLKWWVKAVLKKRLRITFLVKKRNNQYLKKTHKFGIEVPKSVTQAYALNNKECKYPLGRCHCQGDEGYEYLLQEVRSWVNCANWIPAGTLSYAF